MPRVEPSRVSNIGTSALPAAIRSRPPRSRHLLTTEIQLKATGVNRAPPCRRRSARTRRPRPPSRRARASCPRPRQRGRAAALALRPSRGGGALVGGATTVELVEGAPVAQREGRDRAAQGREALSDSAAPLGGGAADASRIAKATATTSRRSRWWPSPASPPPSTRARRRPSASRPAIRLGTLRAKSARGPHATRPRRSGISAPTSPRRSDLDESRPGRHRQRRHLYSAGRSRPGVHVAAVALQGRLRASRGSRRSTAWACRSSARRQERRTKSFRPSSDQRDRYKRDHLGALIGLAQLAPINERSSRYQECSSGGSGQRNRPARCRGFAPWPATRRAGRAPRERGRATTRRGAPIRSTCGIGRHGPGGVANGRSGERAKQADRDVLAAAPDHIEGALALVEVAMARRAATRRPRSSTGCSRASRPSPARPCSAAPSWPARACPRRSRIRRRGPGPRPTTGRR